MADPAAGIRAELVAVVVAVTGGTTGAVVPRVLAGGRPPALPSGPLRTDHDSLQEGARAFVRDQTGATLGYVEQLYTFADLGRTDDAVREISISYLGLTRADEQQDGWASIYDLLPWEDRRHLADDAPADRLSQEIHTALGRWAGTDVVRQERVAYQFGLDGSGWRSELALQRYELLWEAGLVLESPCGTGALSLTGPTMKADHRRILATALSRLRSRLQHRPLVFELMDPEFTLGQLQEVLEALGGVRVHKQNFRRAIAAQELVEPTGGSTRSTGGRPAALYRFRREVFTEREQAGTKLPLPR
ncbi:hypothetical protein ATK17_1691 [Branchiibius hedensis]|uniref:Uncharacterized conserved protein n=1 Tax=Branchiibius hedensis TaxID=672460 RepID=A0A2Y8ZR73_9MICO|nr:hypothetical protein [Branchiibius hedensis]PWJ25561.1 hypothetical protein ATK17_1691 [Branchiibius hedensis]SSA34374.1 Uncharacterized conserved protein [Branchiibius hedensis]